MSETDITIIGGGPVGILLALFIAKQGQNITIIDSSNFCCDEPRAIHLDDESIAIISLVLSQEQIKQFIVPADTIKYKDNQSNLFNFASPQSILNLNFNMHNWVCLTNMYKTLHEELKTFSSSVKMINDKVESITKNEEKYQIKTTSASYYSRLVVGADGASSIVRKSIGIKLLSYIKPSKWLVVDLEVSSDLNTHDHIQYCEKIPYSEIQGFRSHLRYEICLDYCQNLNLDTFISNKNIGNYKVIRQKEYFFRALLAEYFFQHSVVLIGDAAHQTPPTMGLGLCLGIKDVNALYWRILKFLNDANYNIISEYSIDRKKDAYFVIIKSLFLSKIVLLRGYGLKKVRNLIFKLIEFLGVQKFLVNYFLQYSEFNSGKILSLSIITDIKLLKYIYSEIFGCFILVIKQDILQDISSFIKQNNSLVLKKNFKIICVVNRPPGSDIYNKNILYYVCSNNEKLVFKDEFIFVRPDFCIFSSGTKKKLLKNFFVFNNMA